MSMPYCVFVSGDTSGRLACEISLMLSGKQKASVISASHVSIQKDCDVLICDVGNTPRIYCENSLCVIAKSKSTPTVVSGGECIIPFPDLLSLVSCDGGIITCGMSLRDTVTLSSVGEDCNVVSLQRAVTRNNGSLCEPFETPLSDCRHISDYAAMCAVYIMIKTGVI